MYAHDMFVEIPRQSMNVEEGKTGAKCKIRKRGCSSSSSSSLILKNYRLKRAILVGKRGGSSTPVPAWKMNLISPSFALRNGKNMQFQYGVEGKEFPVSARKLAATLWEINEVPSPGMKEEKRRSRDRILKHLADPSHSHVSEKMDGSKVHDHRRRKSFGSQKLLLTDHNLGGLDYVHDASLVEIESQPCDRTMSRCIVGAKNRLKDISNGLTTSKELLKALSRIWCPEQKHSAGQTLFSALKFEIDQARFHVNKLIQEQQQYNRNEVNHFFRQFKEEKWAWKIKERDRIMQNEVDKKMRRQTERLNKRLGKELADTKASLECEKRAREILEQVCDELARGIGEDRTEVEELKKESVKVREEVEKEREMLQLADLLREERVQMKLSEAKYQFEEKNEAVEKLRSELEAYLKTKTGIEDGSPNYDRIRDLEEYLRKTLLGSSRNGEIEKKEVAKGENDEGEHSADESDLHSIELNMDENNKSCRWSYTCGGGSKIKGGKSISEKTQRRSTENQGNINGLDVEIFSELEPSQHWRKDCEDEIERYKMIKDLRDHIVHGSRITSSPGFGSSNRKWGPPVASQDRNGMVVGGVFAVLQDAV